MLVLPFGVMSIAAVIIGRNEGARLETCLSSVLRSVDQVVYVDSGSTDGSLGVARDMGAEVIALDMALPFTAARARNAGLDGLGEYVRYVQLIDGDCELREGWIDAARAHLEQHAEVAVVCGRRRERHPESSVFNALIDDEWDTPVGPALACGGDAMIRLSALRDVGGYRDTLIAGEEPELCVRLRQAGWTIIRLPDEMTWHDAAITRFSQWWQRSRRAGHAFAEGAALHGAPPERHWVRETRRALGWGVILPIVVILIAVLTGPAALALLLVYPLQMLRLGWRAGWAFGVFTVIGKFAEAAGVLAYYWRRLRRREARLIEYK